jgi:hypothetical protein
MFWELLGTNDHKIIPHHQPITLLSLISRKKLLSKSKMEVKKKQDWNCQSLSIPVSTKICCIN